MVAGYQKRFYQQWNITGYKITQNNNIEDSRIKQETVQQSRGQYSRVEDSIVEQRTVGENKRKKVGQLEHLLHFNMICIALIHLFNIHLFTYRHSLITTYCHLSAYTFHSPLTFPFYHNYIYKSTLQLLPPTPPNPNHPMKPLTLIDELKSLKSSKPLVQPPRNRERMQRVMRFQEMNGICLNDEGIYKRKKPSRKGGIFDGMVFCFPLIDPGNDPAPQKLVQLAKGIYSQGGKLVEFNLEGQAKMKIIMYVLVDEHSDIAYIRQTLRDRFIYTAILNYKWVEESLRKFRKLQLINYNLQAHYHQLSPIQPPLQKPLPPQVTLSQRLRRRQDKEGCIEKEGRIEKQGQAVQMIWIDKQGQVGQMRGIEEEGQVGQMRERQCQVGCVIQQWSDSDTVQIQYKQQQRQHLLGSISQGNQILSHEQIQQESPSQHPSAQKCTINIQHEQQTNPSSSQHRRHQVKEEDEEYQVKGEHEVKEEDEEYLLGEGEEEKSEYCMQSKIHARIQSQDEGSDVTLKMQSDDDDKKQVKKEEMYVDRKGYLRQRVRVGMNEDRHAKEEKRQQTRVIGQQPEINRKKTKLAIGSHHFPINNLICEKLKQMQQIYEDTNDRKKFAYLRAIAAIRNYGKQIRDAQELRNIDGLGSKTILKIKQFLQTGNITKVENRLNKNNTVPYKQLLRVYGIGPNTAEQLYHKGIRTIKDLQQHPQLLNRNQKMGVKYVEDLQQRIGRQKIREMLEFIRQVLFYVVRSDSHHEIEAVGSYRRGKLTCGDIDILITRKDGYVEKTLLNNLVLELEKRAFITDHITHPKNYDGRKSVNYMGVCLFKDTVHHRIDLKHYPAEQYAFALLYFTGSDLFNREMRMVAHEKGLILGDSGVRKIQRNGMGLVWRKGKIPLCLREEDIFNLLGMDYKSPGERQL